MTTSASLLIPYWLKVTTELEVVRVLDFSHTGPAVAHKSETYWWRLDSDLHWGMFRVAYHRVRTFDACNDQLLPTRFAGRTETLWNGTVPRDKLEARHFVAECDIYKAMEQRTQPRKLRLGAVSDEKDGISTEDWTELFLECLDEVVRNAEIDG